MTNTSQMTSEQILDQLRALARNHSGGARTREMMELLDEVQKRLCDPITVSFAMSGSPETVGAAVAEMLIRSASSEDVQELRSQIVEAMR